MRKMWRLVVSHADIPTEDEIDSEWFEEVDLIDISPEDTIAGFNGTLRPGGRARRLVAVFTYN